MSLENEKNDVLRLLVSVDFSDCCLGALRKALEMVAGRKTEIIVLHVIDQRFVEDVVRLGLSDEGEFKKKIFLDAKARLKTLIETEHLEGNVKPVVCEGIPYMEINRKAEEFKANLIVIGSCGMAGDPENIFFGGTAEKVLRFGKRPVLCVPPKA